MHSLRSREDRGVAVMTEATKDWGIRRCVPRRNRAKLGPGELLLVSKAFLILTSFGDMVGNEACLVGGNGYRSRIIAVPIKARLQFPAMRVS